MEKISSKSIRHSLRCCGKVGAMEVWVLKKVLWTFSYAYLWQPIASCWRDSQFLLNRGEEPHVLLSQSSWIFARCKRTLSMIEGILCGMILGHNSSWKQFAVYVERGIKNHLNCTKLQMSQKHPAGPLQKIFSTNILQLALRRFWLPVVRGGWFLFWHRGHLQSWPPHPRLIRPHIQ